MNTTEILHEPEIDKKRLEWLKTQCALAKKQGNSPLYENYIKIIKNDYDLDYVESEVEAEKEKEAEKK